ncbi:MAG: VWA domain-containing protein [Chloroflexota bacterium]
MQADFLLDYDVITVAQDHKLYLMARLNAGPAPDNTGRRPLNLSLVIDRSGSMAGSKIDYTRQAASLLVQNLSNEDTFSIVLYNENVETFLPPQRVEHKDLLRQRIDQIKAGGTTNLSGGWLEGINHVATNKTDDQVNRVILMSDGLANRGITENDKLIDIAKQKREMGVSTTTMGLGEDFHEDLMIAMADAGGGAFYFIESPEVTPGIFQEELRGLLSLIGQNLVITVRPTNHVAAIRQMNAYPEERAGTDTAYRVGDVYGDESKTLMLEIDVPALSEMGEVDIATLRFEYDELSDGASQRKSMEKIVRVNVAAADLDDVAENVEVKRSAMLLKAAEARREAIALADEGKFGEAAKRLRKAAEELRESGLRDDEALTEERAALIAQAGELDKGAENYQKYSRKSMSTQVYFTGHGSHENTQAFRLREQKRGEGDVGATGIQDFVPPIEGTSLSPRKTHMFDGPMVPPESQAMEPISTLSPTHMRWGEQTFKLDGDLIRIGRAPQNEIVINTTGISRFHCQIRKDGTRLLLEDLGSTNGTHVAGQNLSRPYVLREGDVAYLCDQRVTFERQAES